MGVNGPGGTKRMSHWRETGIWPSIYYSEAHLEQIFVHWRRLEEWAQFWKSPLPFISPSPCLFPPAALSRQGSTGTQWPCRRRGKKSGLIYFPLPAAAAAAEGDGGMWSRTMTNKQRSHDCKILRKFLQDEVKRTGCDTRTHKRVLAFSEKKKSSTDVFWGHCATENGDVMTHVKVTTVGKRVLHFSSTSAGSFISKSRHYFNVCLQHCLWL